MVDSPDGLRPGADLQGWFGSQLDGIELASNITMSTLDPLIDSSEATPEDWQAIVDDINAHAGQTDAFLVLHGTDTMAYSAAALSYALADLGKPVVLTGSQYPLGVVGSDASANVTGALRAAISPHAQGVMLFFGHKLLAGNRATKTSSWAFRGFESPSVSPMARTGAPWRWYGAPSAGTGWQRSQPLHAPGRRRHRRGPRHERRAAARDDDAPPGRPHPAHLRCGQHPRLRAGPRGCPGRACTAPRCRSSSPPSATRQKSCSATTRPATPSPQLGAIGAHDMTLEALYAKTVFLLSQGMRGADFTRWMDRSIAGELTPQD